MHDLSMRQQDVLKLLSKSSGSLTGYEIASTLGVSVRTVQNDVLILKRLGLVTADKTGYCLSEVQQNKIDNLMVENSNFEDIKKLIYILLIQSDRCDIDDLADEMIMSTVTLKRRLHEVEEYISHRELHIELKNNTVSVCGSETQKRKTIRHFIFQDISPDFNSIEGFEKYFSDMDAPLLRSIIVEAIHVEGYLVDESYSSSLFLALMIALYRIKNGQHTVSSDRENPNDTCEFRIAERLSDLCKEKTDINMTDSDVHYISSLFYGQLKPENIEAHTADFITDFESTICSLLNHVLNYYMISIEFSPYVKNLSLHINDLLKRAEGNNYVASKMYKSIQANLPFVYEVAIHFATVLNERYQIELPNDEIGFLGVHIGLLIETAMADPDRINVEISTTNYQNINLKLKAMFKKYSDDSIIINVIPFSSVNMLHDKKVDLIISTTPLNIIGKRVVGISPLLTKEDKNKIDLAIKESIREKNTLKYHSYLYSFFDDRLFFRRNDISSYSEAISFLGSKIIELGLYGDGYIESVMIREQLSSTCFFDSFAIPHALEMHANQTVFAVLINENGISWDNCRIKLCILIAVCEKDRNAFSQTYNSIVRVLCDNVRLRTLIKSKTLPEFLNNLKSKGYEERHYNV